MRRAAAIVVLLLAVTAADAEGQAFLGSRPDPDFTIGPIFVRATVTPELGRVTLDLLWSLVIPPTKSGGAIEQDLYLLWPNTVDGDTAAGPPDPVLAAYVTEHGFTPIKAFNDVRARALFPLYFQGRDRVIRLADDPSQLIVNLRDAEHLKIDEIYPRSAGRKLSETLDSTEEVSLFLDRSEGLTPQVLTVQFGYFTGMRSWAPVLIPMAFFVLGNLAMPIGMMLARRVSAMLASRVQLGPPTAPRRTGVILSRETIAGLAPGVTTYAEVLRSCGPDPEEHEELTTPGRRTLVYRGQRVAPQGRRGLGWLATVSHWSVERHEVEIVLERDVVADVQARVRRTPLATPPAS